MDEVWYKEGLRFSCTGCGACCTGSPGYVWVTDEEIQEMAAFLGIDPHLFSRKYIRLVYGRKALIEMKQTFDCVFLKDKKCSLYSVRPKQCRTFPWWQQNLKTPEAWQEAAKHCEGISDQADVVSLEVIERSLTSTS